MTASELLAELMAQGFCLEVCHGGIGVVPASRLTDTQIRAIRTHEAELLVLLRTGAPSRPKGTPRKKKQQKGQKRVAVPKADVEPGGARVYERGGWRQR